MHDSKLRIWISIGVVLLTYGGCTARSPEPRSGPFRAALAKPTPNPRGQVYSVSEHPFMFYGQLLSGDSTCDATKGFTFASVKDISGTDTWDCKFEVTHDDSARAINWTATCGMLVLETPVVRGAILQISDDEQVGRDGTTMIRSTNYFVGVHDVATNSRLSE